MIPTFLGIALIVFAVLNLAPGKRPGAAKQGTDLAADVRNQTTQESYRIFREQFNLDKPVLFNTLFALERSRRCSRCSRVVAGDGRGETRPSASRRRSSLEDFGQYAVPHLVEIIAFERFGVGQSRRSRPRGLLPAPRRAAPPDRPIRVEPRRDARREPADQRRERSRFARCATRSMRPEAEKQAVIVQQWLGRLVRGASRALAVRGAVRTSCEHLLLRDALRHLPGTNLLTSRLRRLAGDARAGARDLDLEASATRSRSRSPRCCSPT